LDHWISRTTRTDTVDTPENRTDTGDPPIIVHEYEEDRLGSHQAALKLGAKTALPVTDGARRILRAMGR